MIYFVLSCILSWKEKYSWLSFWNPWHSLIVTMAALHLWGGAVFFRGVWLRQTDVGTWDHKWELGGGKHSQECFPGTSLKTGLRDHWGSVLAFNSCHLFTYSPHRDVSGQLFIASCHLTLGISSDSSHLWSVQWFLARAHTQSPLQWGFSPTESPSLPA
jgi:hypothetical protein